MSLSIIVALAENGVIGRDNTLPWHLSPDLKRFKKLTTGHPVIMGRKTFESIGRALPGRTNVIVTRQKNYWPVDAAGVRISGDIKVVHSLHEALGVFTGSGSEVFVIGGAEVFKEALPLADRLYLTIVHAQIDGDVRLTGLPLDKFRETHREKITTESLPFSFVDYQKL